MTPPSETPSAPKRVLLAEPRGYCAGVDRAVQTVHKRIAPERDLVIVVGSRNSSNSVRLVEAAREARD